MEDPNDLMILNDEHSNKILDYLKLYGFKWNDNNKLYMLIDEIHLLNNTSKFIKLFVDHHKDITIKVKSGDYFKNPPRAFIECMDALKLNKGIIFNKSRYEKILVNGKTIVFYSYMFLG